MVGIELIIGHLIGDYFLQNDWMARNKSENTIVGYFACFIHCLVYSLVVASFVIAGGWVSKLDLGFAGSSMLIACLLVFISHYPIDKTTLGKWWMIFFKQSRSGPFAPCVYIGVDNGMHLALMWIGFSILGL